jgi:hypothetical protein
MGMHIGLIAVRASVAEFRQAFSQTWPEFETVATTDDLPNGSDIWSWKQSHEQFVSAADWSKENPGRSVFVFWPDGPWAVMWDPDYILASDQGRLQRLSHQLGKVISFIVESTGGFASFCCYQDGKRIREIRNEDLKFSFAGDPLPEEIGIDVTRYYMDQTEALWQAFGLVPFDLMHELQGLEAICVIDRTDYGAH